MRFRLLVCTLLGTACGGGSSSPVVPETGPAGVVDQFMRAVADSNLGGMAELWGTNRGSAAQTHEPPDYQRRVAVMFAYLRGTSAKVLGQTEGSGGRVVLGVEVRRANCARRVPFTMVRTRAGAWLVTAIDLAAAGTPGQPCPSEAKRPGS